MSEPVLIIDDDIGILEGLAAGLEACGRDVITCSDIESAEIVLENKEVGCVVCDVRLSGPLSIDGIEFIDRIRIKPQGPKLVMMSGGDAAVVGDESLRRGATHFLSKPFRLSELESLLGGFDAGSGSIVRMPSLPGILGGGSLTPHFQPILDIATGKRFGYEALIRFPDGAMLDNPELLFEYARRKLALPQLETVCLQQAMNMGGALLADDAHMFLNVSPLSFGDPLFSERLLGMARHGGIAPQRLVVEISEQDSFDPRAPLPSSIAELTAAGVQFAFDDVGSAYSHLARIAEIRPRFLKISQSFGSGFEQDPTKEKIVRNIAGLARAFDCEVILEGIECEATLVAASELGIGYGQGYYIARPAPAATFAA